MSIRIIFNRFFPPINPLERKLLNTVADHLSPGAKSLFMKQIDHINFGQRLVKGKEVNLYCIKHGKPAFDDSLRFPISQVEVKLATVSFKALDIAKPFRAVFWVVQGHFFSIEFNQSPKKIRPEDITITEVEILVDPMVSCTREPRKSIAISALSGWVKEWAHKWNIDQLKEPLLEQERNEIINQLATKLPIDYLDIIMQTEGMKIDGCLIFGLLEIRSVVMADSNYCILAEIEGHGVLMVEQGSSYSEIYYLDYENEGPYKKGPSFRVAIENQLDNSIK
ncbi:MAG: hypothetical protein ACE14V_15420 [bacterium]